MASSITWLLGKDPTPQETWVALVTAMVAGLAAGILQLRAGTGPVFTIVAGMMAFDLAGGCAVNASGAGKRWYHRPRARRSGPIWFAALHVHPFLLFLVPDGISWWKCLAIYALGVGGTLTVVIAPRYLKLPLAMGIVASASIVATGLAIPPPWIWLPSVLLLKLVVAHAVPPDPNPWQGVAHCSREPS